jgi:hypothetical protein
VAALLALTACGPVPVAQAERQCRDQVVAEGARLGGAARIGVATGPEGARIERRMDLDITLGHVPGGAEEAWRRCVFRNAGQLPTRPFQP